MKKHVTIQIEGRVQDVWFRLSAKEVVDSLSIGGYAKNNKDSTVTIEVYSTIEKLEKLISWCDNGSEMADVKNVQYIIGDKCKKCNDFKSL